jgi:hypothetical protein
MMMMMVGYNGGVVGRKAWNENDDYEEKEKINYFTVESSSAHSQCLRV